MKVFIQIGKKKYTPEDLITQAECARRKKCSRSRVHQLVEEGKFNTVEIAGITLIIWN